MDKTPSNSQSAVDRRSAEAQLRRLVAAFAPAHERLVAALRRALRKRVPAAHEVVYGYNGFFVISYSPDGRGYEGALAIRASAEGVRLYFNRGRELPDPGKLMQGSGRQVRWIDVPRPSTLARPAIAQLIDAAIARSPVPFAGSGHGPIAIRSTTAGAARAAPRETGTRQAPAGNRAASRTPGSKAARKRRVSTKQ